MKESTRTCAVMKRGRNRIGVLQADSQRNSICVRGGLYPVLSLKARVALVKDIYAGESVGYGMKYIADTDKRIAVLPTGYADGIPRTLSNGRGRVLIHGREAKIIGNICMDQMMVDVTEIPSIKCGDEAVIIGKSGSLEISVYDIAEECGTITNEILSRLGSRLDRKLV